MINKFIMNKKKYGQFYTTNYKYILQNFKIPKDIVHIIEPFAGNGDLLNFIVPKDKYKFELYDIDPKNINIIKKDTLLNPPNYNNKFILTNPPYLARNKNNDKKLYDKYDVNDLYKCFIKNILQNKCKGGILIIPLNFFCSIRKKDILLRKEFLNIYNIKYLNIFEERIFNDTTYTICSFIFQINNNNNINNEIKVNIYPSKKNINIVLNKENNYTFGGELYNIKINKDIQILRATRKSKKENISNILLKCIDDNDKSLLGLKIIEDNYKYIDNTPKLSKRSYACLVIIPMISLNKQKKLVNKFNNYINEQRVKYNSLFLNNYRESNIIARKRISFTFAFNICNYLLTKI